MSNIELIKQHLKDVTHAEKVLIGALENVRNDTTKDVVIIEIRKDGAVGSNWSKGCARFVFHVYGALVNTAERFRHEMINEKD